MLRGNDREEYSNVRAASLANRTAPGASAAGATFGAGFQAGRPRAGA